ncbi:MAG: hypothetical protein WEF50_01705 [Myxococcota bacterium]
MADSDPLEAVTFQANSLDEVPYPEVRETLRQHTVVRIRGLFDPEEIRATKREIAARFDPANDRKHDPRDTEIIRTNFQKLQVGCTSGMGTTRDLGRVLRMLFNPIFADDVYGMRRHFVLLARFRNLLYELDRDFAVFGTEEGYWTAARIHQYPRGGGFMSSHRDAFTRIVATEAGVTYAQPFLLMSEKGVDFQSGGAFTDLHGERVYYESGCQAGDVVAYDGQSIHGVGDIDPLEPLDMTSLSGRIVAFAALYRHLKPGASDYGELSRRAIEGMGH